MPGIVEVIDPTIELVSRYDLGEITGQQDVVEFEVQRAFAAGGSLAEIDVVFTDDFDDAHFERLSEMVDRAREYNPDSDAFSASTIANSIHDHPLNLHVDVELVEPTLDIEIPGDNRVEEKRIFTGHVTKVVEHHDGIVTFEAMDARHYMNKNMVTLDVTEEGAYVDDLVEQILYDDQSGGLGFRPEEVHIDLRDPVRVRREYGTEYLITAFEVLDDLRMMQDAWFYIDNYNHVHFRDIPEVKHRWGYGAGPFSDSLPPIIEWESGDEETEENIIVQSTYDETGLGPYTWVSEETFEESSVSGRVSGSIADNPNVFSRAAVENERDYLLRQAELMADSGTIRVTGDPRLEPNDRVTLSNHMLGDFSPISAGEYSVKEVRHTLDSNEGFVSEVDIGKDPKELYERFVSDFGSENAEQSHLGIDGEGVVDEEDGGDGLFGSIREMFNTGMELSQDGRDSIRSAISERSIDPLRDNE